MYYSKNGGVALNVPKNYGGNAFRNDHFDEREPPLDDTCEKEVEKQHNEPPRDLITSLLSGISAEDILLLGLIFIIHQENPNDNTLLLLLILLLAK